MGQLNMSIKNSFDVHSMTIVHYQIDGGTEVPINPQQTESDVPLDQGNQLTIRASLNEVTVNCSLRFNMTLNSVETDDFQNLILNFLQADKKFILDNQTSGNTNVNVSVGDDGQ